MNRFAAILAALALALWLAACAPANEGEVVTPAANGASKTILVYSSPL